MGKIKHGDINEKYAYSGYVEAGDFVFLTFCVGNVGKSVEDQVEGALDNMASRLKLVDLKLSDVVKVDVLLRDPWNILIMEKVFKRRFKGTYPARKTISTDFAHFGRPGRIGSANRVFVSCFLRINDHPWTSEKHGPIKHNAKMLRRDIHGSWVENGVGQKVNL